MPHHIWSGSISFGLVTIPIKLFPATDDKAFSFNQLCPKGHRIKYKRWCPVEEGEIPYLEIKKGYEIEKDNYVIIEKNDLDKIKLKTTKSVDIKEFVDSKELDPIIIEKSYYVAPDTKRGNDKAYSLLVKILSDTKKIAIGKIVLRDKENIVSLRPYQRGMVMHILRYLDEIRPTDDIPEILAENAGMSLIDAQAELRTKSEGSGKARYGIDVFKSKIADLSTRDIYEPLTVKNQIINSATEAA